MNKLNQPTPRKNVIFWQFATFFYFMIIFINENFSLISAFDLDTKIENIIRIIGAFIYSLMTFYNFNKSSFDQKKPK